ncbi:MAG: hypothetical protein KKC51_14090 [Verrucomicrobia bacterium]|nr:hypothetical protein [Verrucomicrobiota bacterium]
MILNEAKVVKLKRDAKKLARAANYAAEMAEWFQDQLDEGQSVTLDPSEAGTGAASLQTQPLPDGSCRVRINDTPMPRLPPRLWDLLHLLLDEAGEQDLPGAADGWKSVALLCAKLGARPGRPISSKHFNQLAHRLRDWLGAYADLLQRDRVRGLIRFMGRRA